MAYKLNFKFRDCIMILGKFRSRRSTYNKFTEFECFVCHVAPATAAVLRERIKDTFRIIALKQAILILKQENYHKAKGISKVWRRLITSK